MYGGRNVPCIRDGFPGMKWVRLTWGSKQRAALQYRPVRGFLLLYSSCLNLSQLISVHPHKKVSHISKPWAGFRCCCNLYSLNKCDTIDCPLGFEESCCAYLAVRWLWKDKANRGSQVFLFQGCYLKDSVQLCVRPSPPTLLFFPFLTFLSSCLSLALFQRCVLLLRPWYHFLSLISVCSVGPAPLGWQKQKSSIQQVSVLISTGEFLASHWF